MPDLSDDEYKELVESAVTAREVTCPMCRGRWLASLTEEDIENGVGFEIVCFECLLGEVQGDRGEM